MKKGLIGLLILLLSALVQSAYGAGGDVASVNGKAITAVASVLGKANAAILTIGGKPCADGDSAPSAIFSDDFETNDFSAWTSEVDTESQLSIASSNCHAGSYCSRYAYTNTADAYTQKTLAQNYTEAYVQFWFRVNDVTAVDDGSGGQQTMLWMGTTGGVKQMEANARVGASPYDFVTVRTLYTDDASNANVIDVTLNPSADTWYCYRAYRKKSTGVDQADGILRVWVSTTCGGGTPAEVTTIDDDEEDIWGIIRLGESSSNAWVTSNETVFLYDDILFDQGAP
jgi:hypothetical protein